MVCPDPEGAANSLAPILSGQLDGPGEIFGIGSNSEVPVGYRKQPVAIIFSARIFAPFAMALRSAANAANTPAEQMRDMDSPNDSITEIKERLNVFVESGLIKAN